MALADRIVLSNDSTSSGGGIHPDEQMFEFSPVSETSATTTQTLVPVFQAKANGRIIDAYIGVAQTAVSASGFISGSLVQQVRINSVACLSTQPSITEAAASAATSRSRTNNSLSSLGATVSAVVNAASGMFSAGDQISMDITVNSAGSAAAGLAFAGLYAGIVVRYAAF